jgi:hypothetical protein
MGLIHCLFNLSLLMCYIYTELLVKPDILSSCIYGPTFGKAERCLFLFAAQCFSTESMQRYPVAQLCVNTLLATRVTLRVNEAASGLNKIMILYIGPIPVIVPYEAWVCGSLLLGLWVRIPLGRHECISLISVVCCQI